MAPPRVGNFSGTAVAENADAAASTRSRHEELAAVVHELEVLGWASIADMEPGRPTVRRSEGISTPTHAACTQTPTMHVQRRLLQATPPGGKPMVVHAFAVAAAQLRASRDGAHWLVEFLRKIMWLCSIVHPHFVVPRSLICTRRMLCVTADRANGGPLFAMVRHSGSPGLAAPAAAFLFQQLITSAQFAQRVGVALHRLPPSKLLTNWTAMRLPLLRINIFHLAAPPSNPASPPDQVRYLDIS
eukprot:jgi/Ulvmu1/11935/UM082_0014.1